MKPHVLIVDDERALAGILRCSLEQEGFVAVEAHDFEEALSRAVECRPDAVILDSALTVATGFEIGDRIRDVLGGKNIPIIVMMPNDRRDECACDENGAFDDCIGKPFGMSDLIARLRAAIGRAQPMILPETLKYADLTLDLRAFRVTRGDHAVHLGPTELQLLRFFLQHPRRVFSRENLLEAIWGRDAAVEPRTVDVHILRLRKAINVEGAPDIIRTVRSAGYALDIKAKTKNIEADKRLRRHRNAGAPARRIEA